MGLHFEGIIGEGQKHRKVDLVERGRVQAVYPSSHPLLSILLSLLLVCRGVSHLALGHAAPPYRGPKATDYRLTETLAPGPSG